MSDLKTQFDAVVAQVASAPAEGNFKPSNEMKLQMYALYSQATKGDASGKRPGMLNPVGRFKFDAWAKLSGTSQEAAMQQYIEQVQKIEAQHG
jgi:diazepam-binding inhibitor (GABA receptor modulating acyl-CoA-binding protein)